MSELNWSSKELSAGERSASEGDGALEPAGAGELGVGLGLVEGSLVGHRVNDLELALKLVVVVAHRIAGEVLTGKEDGPQRGNLTSFVRDKPFDGNPCCSGRFRPGWARI